MNSDSDYSSDEDQEPVTLSKQEQLDYLKKKLSNLKIGAAVSDGVLQSHTTYSFETSKSLVFTITRGTITLYSERKIYMKLLTARDVSRLKGLLIMEEYSYIREGTFSTRAYRITASEDKPSAYFIDKPGFYIHLTSDPMLYVCANDEDMESMKAILYFLFSDQTYYVAREGPPVSMASSKTTISVKVSDLTRQAIETFLSTKEISDSSSGSDNLRIESSLFGEMQISLMDYFPIDTALSSKVKVKSRTQVMDNLKGFISKLKIPKNKNPIIISKISWKRQKHLSFLNNEQLRSLERACSDTIDLVNLLNPNEEKQKHMWESHYIDGEIEIDWSVSDWKKQLREHLDTLKMDNVHTRSHDEVMMEKEDEHIALMKTYAGRLSQYYYESTTDVGLLIDNMLLSMEAFVDNLDKDLTDQQKRAYMIILTNLVSQRMDMQAEKILDSENI